MDDKGLVDALPERKRTPIQEEEAELARRLLADLEGRKPDEPSRWGTHPRRYSDDTARVVSSRINTGRRREFPNTLFESKCIGGVIYIRARSRQAIDKDNTDS